MTITEINIHFTLYTVIVVLIGAGIDIKHHLIPNRLIYPGIVGAVFYHLLTRGLDGFIFSLTGLFGGIGMLLIPFLLRWIGAGDAKLLGFIGAAWGWPSIFEIFILATLSGGVIAIGVIIANPRLLIRLLKNAYCFFANLFISLKNFALLSIGNGNFGSTFVPNSQPSEDGINVKDYFRIPYGVAIAMGTIIWLVLNLTGHPLTFL